MARGFIPEEFDSTKWENLEPITEELLRRELRCSNCIEGLIGDSSELAEHVSEAGALLYIGMTCDTESDEKRSDFLDFVENVRPKLSEFSDKLNRKIVGHPEVENLPERYNLMIRGIKTDIEIFRKENIALSVRQTELITESQTIKGAMTVVFENEEKTFPQMGFQYSSILWICVIRPNTKSISRPGVRALL